MNSNHTRIGAEVGYASGNLAKSIQRSTIDLVLLYFLIEIVGIGAAVAGLIMLVATIWDAISDPLLAQLIDKMPERRFRYQRIIGWAAPTCALLFIALFATPLWVSSQPILAAVLASLLFRTAYTLVDVPHNALLASGTADSRERSRLSALRFFFSSAGTLFVAWILVPSINTAKVSGSQSLFIILAAVALGYTLIMWTSAYASKRLSAAGELSQSKNGSLLKNIRQILTNRHLTKMLIVFAASAALITVFSKMSLFYALSWLGDTSAATILVSSHAVGQIISIPGWTNLANRTEKKTAAMAAHALLVLTVLLFFFMRPDSVVTASIFYWMAGCALSGLTVMNWALIPDTVEYNQLQGGHRHEALTFGILLLINKAAAGFSFVVVGYFVSVSGYTETTAAGSKLSDLITGMALAPIVGGLVSLAILFSLAVTHDSHRAVRHRIRKGR